MNGNFYLFKVQICQVAEVKTILYRRVGEIPSKELRKEVRERRERNRNAPRNVVFVICGVLFF